MEPNSHKGLQPVLFGIPFTQLDLKQVCALLLRPPKPGQGVRSVVTANVDHVVRLQSDERLRSAYAHAWLRTIDGRPLHAYARLLALNVQHVTGADIVPELLEGMQPGVHRPFFIISDDVLAAKLRAWGNQRGFSDSAIGTDVPPMGFEGLADCQEALAAKVCAHRPTHVFMAIGCPRSEIWLDRFRDRLGDVYALSIGSALAFHVGTLRRAPKFVRSKGLEWLWRVANEPRRLAKRYFVHSWAFAGVVFEDLRARRRGENGIDIGLGPLM